MQGGLVRASAKAVRLADVEFRVRVQGRERMLRTQQKNVHAYAIGQLVDFLPADEPARTLPVLAGRSVFYDAYRFDAFVNCDDHTPVHNASVAQFDESGATYIESVTTLPAAA